MKSCCLNSSDGCLWSLTIASSQRRQLKSCPSVGIYSGLSLPLPNNWSLLFVKTTAANEDINACPALCTPDWHITNPPSIDTQGQTLPVLWSSQKTWHASSIHNPLIMHSWSTNICAKRVFFFFFFHYSLVYLMTSWVETFTDFVFDAYTVCWDTSSEMLVFYNYRTCPVP